MKTIKVLFLILIMLSFSVDAFTQRLNDYQRKKVESNSKRVITKYANNVNLLGDINEEEEDKFYYKRELIKLFNTSAVFVFNDLDPTLKTGRELSITKYADYIPLWYTSTGLTTSINEATISFGDVKTNSDGLLYIETFAQKKISGVYLKSESNQQTIDIMFEISFDLKKLDLENFKIVGIKNKKAENLPAKAGTITGKSSVSQNDVVKYSVKPIEKADSYEWTLPAGANGSSFTNTIMVEFSKSAKSGNVIVRGVNSYGKGEVSSLAVIVKKILPKSAGKISGKNKAKRGETDLLYVVSPIQDATSYKWTLPAGFSGTSSSNVIRISVGDRAVSGLLKVSGVNQNGQGKESNMHIEVVSPQPVSFTQYSKTILSIKGSPTKSTLNINSDEDINSTSDNGIDIGLSFNHFFNDTKLQFGVVGGVGFRKVASAWQLNAYANEFSGEDADNEAYTRIVTANELLESASFSGLDFSVGISSRYNISNKLSLLLNGGVCLSIFTNMKSEMESGEFTTSAHYNDYELVLSDVPQIGLVSNSPIENPETTNSSVISFFAEPALMYNISDKLGIMLGYRYIKGTIKNTNDQILIDEANKYKGLSELSNTIDTSTGGIVIGISLLF